MDCRPVTAQPSDCRQSQNHTLAWPGEHPAGLSWLCERNRQAGLARVRGHQRPRSSCPCGVSLQYSPLASSLDSPLQSTLCLKANDSHLWKRCRYFYIFVWDCEKVKTCVYFVLVLTLSMLGDLWKELSLFFFYIRKSAQLYLNPVCIDATGAPANQRREVRWERSWS